MDTQRRHASTHPTSPSSPSISLSDSRRLSHTPSVSGADENTAAAAMLYLASELVGRAHGE